MIIWIEWTWLEDNFPMSPSVRLSVGLLVGQSVSVIPQVLPFMLLLEHLLLF